MKVSYRRFPFLELLKAGSFTSDEFPIRILTQPYMDAIEGACDRLNELVRSDQTVIANYKGVFAGKHFAFWFETDEEGHFKWIANIALGDVHWMGAIVKRPDGTRECAIQRAPWLERTEDELRQEVLHAMDCAGHMVAFTRYAEIETRHLKPGQRDPGYHCKYANDTKFPVTIMDSTWFTTLVKSDAFKVRGHFRLQPCGEGMLERKLIWINDFMKDGYTAPARKIAALQEHA